jgi:hypothetical protein
MATLNVTEYAELANYPVGVFLMGVEPALARQSVTFTTSTESSALQAGTRFLRLVADADAYLEFAASPTATAASTRLKADTVEFIAVEPGQGLKVAAYDGTS